MWFNKNINKNCAVNAVNYCQNISLDKKCPLDIFKGSHKIKKTLIFRVYRRSTINGATFTNPKIHCFSNSKKPLKNKTSLIKCKMDIFKNQECPS